MESTLMTPTVPTLDILMAPAARELARPEPGEFAWATRMDLRARSKLLIIDDEPTNVRIVQRLLELEGYRHFASTCDSRDGLALIEEEQPDCVLLDLMMPYVSGLDLLEGIRQEPSLRSVPVVVLTASTDRKMRTDALAKGATDFLNKPVDPAELAPRLANVLAAKSYYDQLQRCRMELDQALALVNERSLAH